MTPAWKTMPAVIKAKSKPLRRSSQRHVTGLFVSSR